MTAPPSSAEFTPVERDMVATIGAAGIGLRFDRVVLRLLARLKQSMAECIGDGEAVIFTLTAPIRQPARTAAAMEGLLRDGLPDHVVSAEICGNRVRLRRIAGVPEAMPNVIGFVHNPDADAGLILALAKAELLGQER